MSIQDNFPNVHWIWKGAISYVFEVHPHIVVKVPKSADFDIEQFRKEVGIYNLFACSPPCAYVVQCFHKADNGIFLEYMRGATFCNVRLMGFTDCLTRCVPTQQNTR